ncbi:MAG: hypothetical protein ACKV2V_08170 [Blastocatellia bacterium]
MNINKSLAHELTTALNATRDQGGVLLAELSQRAPAPSVFAGTRGHYSGSSTS